MIRYVRKTDISFSHIKTFFYMNIPVLTSGKKRNKGEYPLSGDD